MTLTAPRVFSDLHSSRPFPQLPFSRLPTSSVFQLEKQRHRFGDQEQRFGGGTTLVSSAGCSPEPQFPSRWNVVEISIVLTAEGVRAK